jgi:hypothetical protein
MRTMRTISLLFMVWSIAFFFIPDFRESLQVPFMNWNRGQGLTRLGGLSPETLDTIESEGEQQHDARKLAFAALHIVNGEESARLADEAVKLDPQLTWIYYSAVSRNRYDAPHGSHENPAVDQWITRLQAWDRGNGLPYLLEGEQIRYRRGSAWPVPEDLEGLEKETQWRRVMAKAFAGPHYQSYATRRFELERDLLRNRKLDRPAVVLLSFISYPIPDLLNVRSYGNLLVNKVGKEAEQAGRLPEAMGSYWTVAHFGEQMQLNGPTLLEKHIGADLQNTAYEHLLPLLRRLGRTNEAATVEYAQQELLQRLNVLHGRDQLARSSNYNWGALAVHLFAGLVMAFGVLAVLAFVYVNAKRWVRPEKKGRLYQMFLAAENYLPFLLFLACLGLYLSYYPYAENFRHYMSASGQIHDLEPLFFNVLPNFFGPQAGKLGLPLENPFRPYIWYALAGLGLVVLVSLLFRRAERP